MTQINPFAGAIAQTPQAQRLAAADRDAQVRKTAARQKTTGFTDQPADEFVESADAVEPVGDEEHHPDPRKKKRKPSKTDESHEQEPQHIDIRG